MNDADPAATLAPLSPSGERAGVRASDSASLAHPMGEGRGEGSPASSLATLAASGVRASDSVSLAHPMGEGRGEGSPAFSLIEARLSMAAPSIAGDSIMYAPAGLNALHCKVDGRPGAAKVLIDAASAATMQRQFAAIQGRSAHKPYFDFDHKDGEASFWPERFEWRDAPAPGVYAIGEWSAAGKAAIEGKNYRSFSPKCWVEDPAADPTRLVVNPAAELNMGGLVNAPSFHAMAPLWAKETPSDALPAPAPKTTVNTIVTMPDNATAAAAATPTASAEVQAKETEITGLRSQLEAAHSQLAAQRKKDAQAAVAAAVKRGALPAQAAELQAKWTANCEAHPEMIAMLDGIEGQAAALGARLTTGSAAASQISAKEGPARILKAYSALVAKNSGCRDLSVIGFRQKGDQAREMAEIYAREITPRWNEFRDVPKSLVAEIEAADYKDPNSNLDTLSGTLVAQRTLQLFKLQFPLLSKIYTDFSDMPAQFGQTEATRIIVVPSVQTYDSTLTNGRPAGWTSRVATASTTDVTITLDEHVGVPIVFDSNTQASTNRRLFDEQAPACSYALAKYFVEKIYKLFTLAKFPSYAKVSGSKVPVAYPNYPVAIGDFGRTSLTRIAAIFNPNEVPLNDRIILLNSPYFEQLATDPSLVTFFAGQQAPEIVTESRLPRLAGFEPIEAPNLLVSGSAQPATLVGMALQRAGIVAKTRLSNDYTAALPGSSYGSVTTITDPDIGISVVLVQYVNHTAGYAEWRIQVMLGANVGDPRGGLCLTSQ